MAGKKQERGERNPGAMSHFQGGTKAGRLKELLDADWQKRRRGNPAITRAEAARRYFEEIAVKSGRATYAKGINEVRPYRHGPAPENWPPPQDK